MYPTSSVHGRRFTTIPWVYVSLLLLCVSPAVLAGMNFDGLPKVSNQELNQLRGGFYVNGMNIGFSLETATLVNGVLQGQTSINGLAGSNLIQLGNGNTLSLNAFQNAQGVLNLIQNSLDSQVIQHLTTLNIDMNREQLAAHRVDLNSMINQQGLTGLR